MGNDDDIRSDVTDTGVNATFRIAKVLNDLWSARDIGATDIKPGEVMQLTRLLDSIAETAVRYRADLEFGKQTGLGARLLKNVRKALGYTYP